MLAITYYNPRCTLALRYPDKIDQLKTILGESSDGVDDNTNDMPYEKPYDNSEDNLTT
jgi:hypothetical protein